MQCLIVRKPTYYESEKGHSSSLQILNKLKSIPGKTGKTDKILDAMLEFADTHIIQERTHPFRHLQNIASLQKLDRVSGEVHLLGSKTCYNWNISAI